MAGRNAEPATPDVFEMEREFNAPLRRVWAAWSEAERLGAWWGPKGCTIGVERLEFRPGGFFHYAMQFGSGAPPMWGRFLYREIMPHERLVWLNSFSNEACGISRAPFGPDFPLEIENVVTFAARDGATTIRLRARPFGETAAERAVFDGMHASMRQGYGGTLDQLAAHLAEG